MQHSWNEKPLHIPSLLVIILTHLTDVSKSPNPTNTTNVLISIAKAYVYRNIYFGDELSYEGYISLHKLTQNDFFKYGSYQFAPFQSLNQVSHKYIEQVDSKGLVFEIHKELSEI